MHSTCPPLPYIHLQWQYHHFPRSSYFSWPLNFLECFLLWWFSNYLCMLLFSNSDVLCNSPRHLISCHVLDLQTFFIAPYVICSWGACVVCVAWNRTFLPLVSTNWFWKAQRSILSRHQGQSRPTSPFPGLCPCPGAPWKRTHIVHGHHWVVLGLPGTARD